MTPQTPRPRVSTPAPQMRSPRLSDHPYTRGKWTTARAQKYIVAAALITALTYGFRRVVEKPLSSTTAGNHGTPAARILGAGSPPAPLAHWALAFGAGFLGLSVIALGAPELAAALAGLEIVGDVLANGQAFATDLAGLQATPAVKDPGPPAPMSVGSGLSSVGSTAASAATPSTPPAAPVKGKVPAKGGIGHRNTP